MTSGKLNRDAYASIAQQIIDQFGVQKVAFTLRGSLSASDNKWAALLYQDKKAYFSREYLIHLVDRVGGGDSFSAGLIYALIQSYDPQKAIDFAVASSCLKHTMEMDFNLASLEDIHRLMEGDGRVQR